MEKSAAGACGALDDFLCENQKIVRIVVILLADHVDEAGPAMAEADDLIALMKRADSNAADGGIETRDVATSGENADNAFFGVDVCHKPEPLRERVNRQLSTDRRYLESADQRRNVSRREME